MLTATVKALSKLLRLSLFHRSDCQGVCSEAGVLRVGRCLMVLQVYERVLLISHIAGFLYFLNSCTFMPDEVSLEWVVGLENWHQEDTAEPVSTNW